MNIENLRQIQRQVIGHVRGAISGVEAVRNKKDSIWSDTERLTEPARRKDISMVIIEGKVSIDGVMEDARDIVSRGNDEIDRTLGSLLHVEPEDLQRRATLLAPVLGAATHGGNQERLLNLYKARHLQPADRLIIEEAASATIDALGSDVGDFAQDWHSLQQELAVARDPQEAEALSQRGALDETSSYLDAAQALVQVELAVMDPSYDEDRDAAMIAQSLAEAEVTSYETSNASVLEDSAE